MRARNEQGGQLVVIGKDKVSIALKDYPHRVDVYFKHKVGSPPCDPHHNQGLHDKLKWDIHRVHRGHHHNYRLRISWKVHEIREIVWLVYY